MVISQKAKNGSALLLGSIACLAAQSVASANSANIQVTFTEKGTPAVEGEILVKVASKQQLTTFLNSNLKVNSTFNNQSFQKLTISSSPGEAKWFKLKVKPGQSVDDAVKEAKQSFDIISAEPNYVWHTLVGPGPSKPDPEEGKAPELPTPPQSDPNLGQAWGIAKVNATSAWKVAVGSRDVIVADIDTGVDYNHEDLINNIWVNKGEIPGDEIDNDGNGFVDDIVGYDFANKDARPWDDNKHGTHTAGTIAATGGNGVGIAGVAREANIMILKFLTGQGSGTTEDAIKCIQYAIDNGATIMSNSWGGGEFSQALKDVIAEASKKDILFVAAAGNSRANNDSTASYPANYKLDNVLSVASTTRNNSLSSFSNYGEKSVHIAAPGSDVYSTTPDNRYESLSGTSMAAPHVSGAAVVLKGAYPSLTAVEIKELLMESVTKVDSLSGKVIAGGVLNIEAALALAQQRYGAPTGN